MGQPLYGENVLAGLYSNVSLLYEFLLHPDLWTTTNVYNFLLFIVNSLGNTKFLGTKPISGIRNKTQKKGTTLT